MSLPRTFSSAKPMPFGFMSLYKIRVIGFAELKVRNCASNSSCNEKAALNSNFVNYNYENEIEGKPDVQGDGLGFFVTILPGMKQDEKTFKLILKK